MISHGFVLEYAGLGEDSRLLSRYYDGVEEALDFEIKTFSGQTLGYLDATVYEDHSKAYIDNKKCVGSWKLKKAKIINTTTRTLLY